MVTPNGGLQAVSKWSQFYFVPAMGHCGGGQALDQFDLLGAMVGWVEKGIPPTSVIATGKAFPKRSRPLCSYPKHVHYKGQATPRTPTISVNVDHFSKASRVKSSVQNSSQLISWYTEYRSCTMLDKGTRVAIGPFESVRNVSFPSAGSSQVAGSSSLPLNCSVGAGSCFSSALK